MKLPVPDDVPDGTSLRPHPDGWYLYGVVPPDADISLDHCAGVDPGFPVTIIHGPNLYGLASRVHLAALPTSEDPDPELLTGAIVAHDLVLREAAATGRAVVPVPFGLGVPTLDHLRHLLCEHSAALHAALERLEGCDEWGVHVSVPREAAQRAVRSCARQVYERLAHVADDAVIEPVSAGAKESRPSILSAAYLVNRDRVDGFRRTVGDLQQAWRMAGFTIGVSGPWPAYTFARVGCGAAQAEQARVLLGPLSDPAGAWSSRSAIAIFR